MSPGGYVGGASTAEQEEALAGMLMHGDLRALLSNSLAPNPDLTQYLRSFRSFHSLRDTGPVDRREDTQLAQVALITSMLGRMANQQLQYLVQVMMGCVLASCGAPGKIWDMLSALKVVPSHAWLSAFLSKAGRNVREQAVGTQVCVACFDNWEQYLRRRDRNELKHFVTWYWLPLAGRFETPGDPPALPCPPPPPLRGPK